ncbi:MAG: isochorismatase family protein [Acidobacteriota bacterium]|nr:isochorismatase family protein [Acidobacteriota bacterium]
MSAPELLDAERSAVVVIDLQGKLVEMVWQSELVIAATTRLIKLAGIFRRPVILTEQYPEGLGETHPGIRAAFDELDTPKSFVKKVSFGCCGDPGFVAAVDEALPGVPVDRRQIVIAGIETHVCVMQTAVELLASGHSVHVCWECVSGRGEEYRRHALDRLRDLGAVLTNHESVGFEWARTKDHASFRWMNRLFREGQP